MFLLRDVSCVLFVVRCLLCVARCVLCVVCSSFVDWCLVVV